MTMKAHTYYIIFGRPPIGGKLPSSPPLAAPLPVRVSGRCSQLLECGRLVAQRVSLLLVASLLNLLLLQSAATGSPTTVSDLEDKNLWPWPWRSGQLVIFVTAVNPRRKSRCSTTRIIKQ